MSNDWTFEKFTSDNENFQNHIEDSLVFYQMAQELIIGLARYYMLNGTKVIDIGCSTNSLIHRLMSEVPRDCTFVGMDKVNLVEKEDTFYIPGDIRYDCNFDNSSFVTSCFTLEFVDKRDRLPLVKKIYDGLVDNGAFVVIGKTINEDSYMQNMYDGMFLSKKHGNFSWEEIMNKHEQLRGIQVPLTNTENMQMMKDAGFKNVSVFFRYLNFVGIVGVK